MQKLGYLKEVRLLICLLALLGFACSSLQPAIETDAPQVRVDSKEPQPAKKIKKTLRVALYADETYALIPNAQTRISRRMQAVSEQLDAAFGLSLSWGQVENAYLDWGRRKNDRSVLDGSQTLAGLWSELEQRAWSPDADLVILFSVAQLPQRATTSDLENSHFASPFVVVRSLTPLYEVNDDESLHRAESSMLLWSIARVLGVLDCYEPLPARAADSLWPPQWTNFEKALIEVNLNMFYAGRPWVILPQQAQKMLEVMQKEGASCLPQALRSRRALLNQVPQSGLSRSMTWVQMAVANCYYSHQKMRKAFEKYADLAEVNPMLAARKAGISAVQMKDWDDAVFYFRAYLNSHPEDDEAQLELAKALGRSGDDGAALAVLSAFLQREPHHVGALLNLGIAAARMGQMEKARNAWTELLQIDPQNQDAASFLEAISGR